MATSIARIPSLTGSIAPSYHTTEIELSSLNNNNNNNNNNSTSSLTPSETDLTQEPPAYTPDTAPFNPTLHLQIQTPGKTLISLPLPPKPDTIPIFPVATAGPGSFPSDNPAYLSIRPARGSGSCFLVAGEDADGPAVSTTTYRFGPNRPAQVQLFDTLNNACSNRDDGYGGEEGEGSDAAAPWDTFTLTPKGLLTRSVGFKTRLGSFEWRYAGRKERRAEGANNVLVLDRVTKRFCEGGKAEEVRRPVARLVRNEEYRSPGSSASSAGNGGRLMVDLSGWDEGEKTERRMVEALVVTTCVSMLKKEVDRRRAQQFAVMMAAAGGGP